MPKAIRLDAFRYVTTEGWRALTAIEMGMKNHEVVPIELAQKISRCKRTGSSFLRLLKDQLTPNGLVAFETDGRKCVQGYRLTNLGYDYLALHQLFNAGQLSDLHSMIGAGKESDVYLAVAGESCGLQKNQTDCGTPPVKAGAPVVVKFHRLGRTSFRKVREKRDYHLHRNACSWLYLDRLASEREFVMMQALHIHGVSVPEALAHNRNAVVMSYVPDSAPLARVVTNVLRFENGLISRRFYKQALDMLHKIASVGLVHGDLNEFNLMVTGLSELDLEDSTAVGNAALNLVLIDFPQMISRDHPSASFIYQRDAEGIVSFFSRFFDIPIDEFPMDLEQVQRVAEVDVEVKAPGYLTRHKTASQSLRHLNGTILLGSAVVYETSDSSGSCSEEESDNTESSDSSSELSASEDQQKPRNTCVEEVIDCSEQGENSYADTVGESDVTRGSAGTADKSKKQIKRTVNFQPKPESGLISPGEIRSRHKRERRQKEQQLFQRRVKRHTRANIKCQNRASLKAELTLFG